MPEININTQPNLQPKSGINRKTFLLGIIIGVILLVGLTAAFLYLNKPKESTNSVPVVSNKIKSSTPSTKKTTTLKEFSGIFYDSVFDEVAIKEHSHTFTLSYPSDWSVTEDDSKTTHSGGHYYLIQGTNSFTATLSEIPGGIGGGCPDPTPPPDLIIGSEKILINSQAFYITIEGSVSRNEVKDAYIDTDPNYYCMEGVVPLNVKPNDNLSEINFVVSMGFGKNVAKDYFLNSPEYKTAKEILSSFKLLN